MYPVIFYKSHVSKGMGKLTVKMEGEVLEKKYGLTTAIAMVVGVVIGSGVFFKAEKVLEATGGNLPMGILAWISGGLIMVICAYTFALMSTRYDHINGLADYAEAAMGDRFAFYVGWFMATIYMPTLASVLTWVSARYLCVLLGFSITGGECMLFGMVFLIACYALNSLAPVFAGKLQVSVTIIKLVPLFVVAIVGTAVGLSNGMTVENFTSAPGNPGASGMFTAICATAFAYDGWIVATSINEELKDAKKNLPIALIAGTILVVLAYIGYYVGLSGGIRNEELMAGGEQGVKLAFTQIFGSPLAGSFLFVLVVVSCLGCLNGIMLGSSRGMYSLAKKNRGPAPGLFACLDEKTNMPTNSSVMGLLLAVLWLVFFYGANLETPRWFGYFNFDSSELPIITLYAMYIPIFASIIKKGFGLGLFKRYVVPFLAIVSAVFMIAAAIYSHGVLPYRQAKLEGRFSFPVLFYLILFFVIMGIGNCFYRKGKNK